MKRCEMVINMLLVSEDCLVEATRNNNVCF